jgi:hypothetical protein
MQWNGVNDDGHKGNKTLCTLHHFIRIHSFINRHTNYYNYRLPDKFSFWYTMSVGNFVPLRMDKDEIKMKSHRLLCNKY